MTDYPLAFTELSTLNPLAGGLVCGWHLPRRAWGMSADYVRGPRYAGFAPYQDSDRENASSPLAPPRARHSVPAAEIVTFALP